MKVWYALKNYDNNLKKFSHIIDDFYPLSLPPPPPPPSSELISNITSSWQRGLDTASISASFISDLKQVCDKYEPSREVYTPTLAYLSELAAHGDDNDGGDQKLRPVDVKLVDSLHSLLNMSRLAISTAANITDDGDKNSKQTCWKLLLDSLYFIFSQQYSRLFEKAILNGHARPPFSSSGSLVNRTIEELLYEEKNNMSHLTNPHVMLMPALRDMRGFFDKYRSSFTNSKKSAVSNLKFCDPQPPILCKSYHIK